jgi:hypothetical protein
MITRLTAARLVLVPTMGINGAEWAWLGAQSVAAAAILLHRRRARG